MNEDFDERELQLKLGILRRDILTAEARLAALTASIEAAQSQFGTLDLTNALAENQRLRIANDVAGEEAHVAFAALERAVKASQTDPLTGLRNRLGLWDRLQHEIELAKRNATLVAVYFFDLDSFKNVNDTLGHAVGDRLLQHVADILVNTVRASDTVCRLGGDEFAVICPAPKIEDVQLTTAKLRAALSKPLVLADVTLKCSVSLGVGIYPIDSDNPTSLLQKADESMYAEKRVRRASISY